MWVLFVCTAQEIDREIILEVLPDLFPAIEKNNAELARNIMFEVVDLPRNTPGNELEYKASLPHTVKVASCSLL